MCERETYQLKKKKKEGKGRVAGCYVLLPHWWGLYTNLHKLIFYFILYYLDFLLFYIIYVVEYNILVK